MRIALLSLLLAASPALALNEGLQCVPFARAVSGVEIRGDAYTWWDQAEGRYDRGSRPKVGAVLAFKPYGGMRLGHVAAVRKIIDDRNILVSHANWSLIEGTRGHIENNVRVVDVSETNDWSEVRVWFDSLGDIGTTHWPVHGFIYPDKVRGEREVKLAVAELTGDRGGWERSAPVQVAIPQTSMTKTLSFSNIVMRDINIMAAREKKQSLWATYETKHVRASDPITDIIARLVP
jgi:surface antigen